MVSGTREAARCHEAEVDLEKYPGWDQLRPKELGAATGWDQWSDPGQAFERRCQGFLDSWVWPGIRSDGFLFRGSETRSVYWDSLSLSLCVGCLTSVVMLYLRLCCCSLLSYA